MTCKMLQKTNTKIIKLNQFYFGISLLEKI